MPPAPIPTGADDIIDQANKAWRAGNVELHATLMWLLRTFYCLSPDSRTVVRDLEWDYEREAEAQGVAVRNLLR